MKKQRKHCSPEEKVAIDSRLREERRGPVPGSEHHWLDEVATRAANLPKTAAIAVRV
jgi:hypothetical protein